MLGLNLGLAGGEDVGSHGLDFAFKLFKLLGNNFFVVREVTLQPVEGALLIIAVNKLFELRHLLVAHAFSQACTDAHFKRLVHVLEK